MIAFEIPIPNEFESVKTCVCAELTKFDRVKTSFLAELIEFVSVEILLEN